MKLDQHAFQPDTASFFGELAALEVTAPLEGVLRLRHAPNNARASSVHPKLPPKQSWAVIADARLPLSWRQEGGETTLEAAGVSLSLRGQQWTFKSPDGRSLVHCEAVTGLWSKGRDGERARARIALSAPEGEAYLGFGEKVGPLDKRGMLLTFWNTDVIPHHPDTDPLYQSIPLLIGLRDGIAWGFFLDESWRSEVDIANNDPHRVTWETSGPELDAYLIAGPGVLDVVRRYTELTGRMQLPPLWSLGAQQSRWGYASEDDILGVIEGYRSRGLPLDAVYLDIDYMDAYKVWTWDKTRYPDPRGLAERAAAQGVKLVTIVDPGVKQEAGYPVYEQAVSGDYLVRTGRGDLLVGEVWPRPAVFPDFTRPEVQGWWGKLHESFLDLGIAGFWNDMNEPSNHAIQLHDGSFTREADKHGMGTVEGPTLPYDARHGRRSHLEAHNVYALGMARGTFEGLRELAPAKRPFILTRAGFAGIQRYSAVWTGDNSSHWTHLEASIPMLVGLGLSGVAFTGADIPGFVGRPTGELLARWTQLGVFYPLMRNHAEASSPEQEPWRYGEPYLSLCRQAFERRYRLLPTLYTLMHEASQDGLPVLRPLVAVEPGSPEALGAFDQFLFGPDLLVAPVTRPGQSARLAYLPSGEWLEFPNLERPGELVAGGRHVVAGAPHNVTPVWLRSGGAVALTAPATHTTSANWSSLHWHLHASENVFAKLYEDEGEGYGDWRLTTISGGRDGAAFVLRRESSGALPLARSEETIHVYGLGSLSRAEGAIAHHFSDGVAVLRVPADWRELRLEV